MSQNEIFRELRDITEVDAGGIRQLRKVFYWVANSSVFTDSDLHSKSGAPNQATQEEIS